ncbi:Dpy-30 motif family protein [Aspergillus niger]|uniref:Dpy-30 motif family protein n=1 Tax=Aspergillus niger TaxID=5061 RepID=A0A505IAB6_ASPNG|nr:Dpy-30 motif family protein [Aspergillus niger]
MANETLSGYCPTPFLQESLFPSKGGFIDGRFCEELTTEHGKVSCCLPCPLAEWTYGEKLISQTKVASWLGVATLPLCIFLLVSFAVLPPKWTHRHYLSICFTLGICCMEIAFIIPLGVKPEQCYNQITPNDMHTDLSCAWTGALLLFGGWVCVTFSFIRTLAFHLQVCWEIMLGPKFMWTALILGWGIPAVGLTEMLILTGVSYRFGTVCHINVHDSNKDYWAPVVAFGGASLFLQFATLVYCIYVYVKSLYDEETSTTSSGLPSYSASVRTVTARQAYRRIRRNIQKCASEAEAIVPNKATLLAVLILLATVGFWNFVLYARPSIFAGWAEFFKARVTPPHEFVSVDARRTPDPRAYEMISGSSLPPYKTPEPVVRSPSPARTMGARSPEATGGQHYGREARYVRPSMSFSSPRPPSATQGGPEREWDPESTFAKSHSQKGSI